MKKGINIGFYHKFVTCRVGDISKDEFKFFINWLSNPIESELGGLDWSKFRINYYDFLETEQLSEKQNLTFKAFMDCYSEFSSYDEEFMNYIFRQKNINDLLEGE